MTQDEAEKLARIFETVDGGCGVCIRNVCEAATEAGFGFIWEPSATDIYAVTVTPSACDGG